MAYATSNDIIELYGEDALFVADHDRDGAADLVAVDRALASASDEIDANIGARYPLPLLEVPGFLKTICVDIAVYRLALATDVLSEEHRRRYEDALGFLKRVADGKAALIFTSSAPGEDGEPAAGPRPIVAEGPERLFSRDKMREL
jgi:phage gp36-like protein